MPINPLVVSVRTLALSKFDPLGRLAQEIVLARTALTEVMKQAWGQWHLLKPILVVSGGNVGVRGEPLRGERLATDGKAGLFCEAGIAQ